MPATLSVDLVTGIISFLLTLMILSYLIGDNPLFRVAVYIFVGVSAGYAAAVAWWQVLFPRLMLPLLTGGFFERLLALDCAHFRRIAFDETQPAHGRVGQSLHRFPGGS